MTIPTPAARIDPSKASAVPCLVVDEHEVLATLNLGHLISIVPNPTQFEDKRMQPLLLSDPMMAELASQRETIQRYFTGTKRSNMPKYADFIIEKVAAGGHRGTPTICLGTVSTLTVVTGQDGTAQVAIPYGKAFLAVDGETQRAAWQEVNMQIAQRVQAKLLPEQILEDIRIPVEIHHGLSVEELQALFYTRNVLGTKVNVNEAIAKDTRDPATQIARAVMAMPIRQPNGQLVPTVSLIQQQSRQVGKKAPHWVTLSALRTLVVTTLLGRSGLQYGAKPLPMFDDVDFDALKTEVSHIVHAILQRFAENFADKDQYLIGSPAIMAGIGVTAHRAIRNLPQRRATLLDHESYTEPMTPDQFINLLADIRWDKEGGIWDGIATRKTPKGVTTVAGPKEVGYAVAEAIDSSNPVTAAQIRGLRPEPRPQVESWRAVAPSMT